MIIMNELCSHHAGDNPQDIIAEEISSGQLRYFKHILKRCQQLDKTYHNRAVKANVVGAAYWSPGRKKRKGVAPISALSRYDAEDDDATVAEVAADFNRVMRLEQKMNDIETTFNKYQTQATSAAVTQKADADRRLSILEGKADVTHDVCVKTLASLTQLSQQVLQQPAANQTAAYPQPSVSSLPPMIPSNPANPQLGVNSPYAADLFQARHTQAPMAWNQQPPLQQYQCLPVQPFLGKGSPTQGQSGYAARPGGFMPGGKGERRGKGDRLCFICKLPGHIARFCPNKDPQARQYVGRGQALEAGRQFVAAVEHYNAGGTEEFAPQDLHDQMGDGEGEIAAIDICHVASALASELTGGQLSIGSSTSSGAGSGFGSGSGQHVVMNNSMSQYKVVQSWLQRNANILRQKIGLYEDYS